MAKLLPEELWKRHILERFTALKQSGELKKLRAKGLAILGRKQLLTPEEWWNSFHDRTSSLEYLKWHDECKTLGERFGLAPWTVTMACLLKGYQPEKQPHVIEVDWPRVRVVTESTDSLFLARLAFEAQRLGLYVVQRQGSVETTYLYADPVHIADLEPPPLPPSRPPLHGAFHLRVETPIGYPPEAARELQKEAGRLGREILQRLGYSVPQRLRTSSLISLAKDLRVGKGHLPSGGAYNISDQVYGEVDSSQDQQRRKTIKSRRHKLRKRLVDRYQLDSEKS